MDGSENSHPEASVAPYQRESLQTEMYLGETQPALHRTDALYWESGILRFLVSHVQI